MVGWRFWIDRGGTFTDVVAQSPSGKLITHKLLSENPDFYNDAPLQGIRDVLEINKDEPIPVKTIDAVKIGTTIATNALLERKGERTALVINSGFADALKIGYQNRPDIFARKIILPEMLYEEVVEINGRVAADGSEILPLDTKGLMHDLIRIKSKGINSLAIVFMFSFRYPEHELIAKRIASEVGFTQISVSHELSPLIKLVSRGDTTVVDAYLSPLLRRYIDNLSSELIGVELQFMQSSGGLVEAKAFCGKDAILSGPSGGVVGAAKTSSLSGFDKIIGFDMGGTSTDVSRFDGQYERQYDSEVAGIRIRSPMMNIHTVAAGGGSILHFDGARYRVGPESAGAEPGPACYRRGGPLTVTDCNVMLGKISPRYFPQVFGKSGCEPIDELVVKRKFEDLACEIALVKGSSIDAKIVAEGFLKVAVQNMANAIKKISVQKGYDLSDYTLTCFGAAGGQHACLVADALAIDTILIHPYAGVLSAYGIGQAEVRDLKQETIEKTLSTKSFDSISLKLKSLVSKGILELKKQGIEENKINVEKSLRIRYLGTDTALTIAFSSIAKMIDSFESAHLKRFGFVHSSRELIVESALVESIGTNDLIPEEKIYRQRPINSLPDSDDNLPVWINGQEQRIPVFQRDLLEPSDVIEGPALIIQSGATTMIESSWAAKVTNNASLIITRLEPLPGREFIGTGADPVMLEVFNNLFMSIAEQMGSTLRNTAHSVNIKERLDFSCAVFDRLGGLVANAPHMPVHLGSMGDSVKTIINSHGKNFKPGDVYALNAPYNGGTHLPDITIITPVFDDDGKNIIFFVASRGHHADIGGITPGSMPPFSKSVKEEGILIDSFKVVSEGKFREKELLKLLSGGEYPVRNPKQNIADIRAKIAANKRGEFELNDIVSHFGLETVHAYMSHVQDNAEKSMRKVIVNLDNGKFNYPLDDGSEICVSIKINKIDQSAVVDFTGTSSQKSDNFNAPASVCRASVLYVFRTLINDIIPMNEGCLKPIKIIIPEGCMLNPQFPAAVVAGNVETSSHITDAIYGALGLLAASQGTMNNFTFGNEITQYYETVCGGSGAGPDFKGTDAVQTHMTNSRLTDPEILEWRFPVRVESFQIRRGSGGSGRFKGGDGTIRRIRFLQPMLAAILAGHRVVAPFGLEGGNSGSVGKSYVERCDGSIVELDGADQIEMSAGDIFTILTPGGGGFGQKS
ncbi:MAG: 5-oxoprolinase [Alphaproteobacteria bacterium]|nr:5-oxoprolinase [Alphaproteobacteria bacterium]|tara:strand:+ start:3232 stop:6834 length:3603 start_codon:yes stop_codon:yes gene_type:complete